MIQGMRPDLSGVDPLVVNLTHRVCVGDITTRGARTYGDRIALIDGDRSLSFLALESRANALARGLVDRGFARGDVIALQLQNRWEFVVAFFALAKIGVTAMPLNLLLAPEDVGYQLADSGARAIITETAFIAGLAAALEGADHRVASVVVVSDGGSIGHQRVADVRTEPFDGVFASDDSAVEVVVDDRDIVHCLYTSGTTSRPKGVVTSHVAVQIAALSSAVGLGARPDVQPSLQPIALPLFHVTALDCLLLPMVITGGTAVLLRGFDPEAIAAAFTRHRVTHLTLLPMMWAAVIADRQLTEENTAHLEAAIYAMAPMTPELLAAVRARFPAQR